MPHSFLDTTTGNAVDETGKILQTSGQRAQAQSAANELGIKLPTLSPFVPKQKTPTTVDATALPVTQGAGSLSNFRLALKNALNEAGKERVADRFQQTFPAAGGVPGTMGSIVSMIRSSVAAPVEDVFTTILETRAEERNQSMDLLETFAKDGTLGTLPDSALVAIGNNAGLSQETVLSWKTRIATAVAVDDRTSQLEQLKIQSEIEENKAQAQKIRKGADLAPTPVTFSYVDSVLNDPDFVLANVPGDDERDRVSKFIFENKIKTEAVDVGGVADKLDSLVATNQTATLTDPELRLWFINMKEEPEEEYESAVESVSELPIINKEEAKRIAGEVYGVVQHVPVPGEPVGAIIPEDTTEKRKSLFFSEDYVLTPVDFSSFPSIFNF